MVTIRSRLVGADGLPELPRSEPDISLPTGWDGTADATIGAGGDLQAALNAVVQNAGIYIIEITAGVTLTAGPYAVKNKTGTDWLIIRSSGAVGAGTLPGEGVRVTDSDVGQMATLQASALNEQILGFEADAHNVRIIGIEFEQTHVSRTMNYAWLRVNNGGQDNIIFDRIWSHGAENSNNFEGIQIKKPDDGLPMSNISVINSRVTGVQTYEFGGESHAIYMHGVLGGLVENNYTEGAGMGYLNGGLGFSDPDSTLCQDITVRGNHMYKPARWRTDLVDPGGPNDGFLADTKNCFETKEGQRMLIEGNLFENSFGSLQDGVGLVFKSDEGNSTDITVRNNFVLGCRRSFLMSGIKTPGLTAPMLVENNVFWTEENESFPQNFKFGATGDMGKVTVRQNTFFDVGGYHGIYFNQFRTTFVESLTYQNNILAAGGVIQADGGSQGDAAVSGCCTEFDFDYNLIRRSSGGYAEIPGFENFVNVTTNAEINFTTNPPTQLSDFVLLSTSPGHPTTDPTLPAILGADISAITAALNDSPLD